MKEVWIVQTNENRYEVLDAYDTKEMALKCAEFYKGWIYAVFPVQIKSEFIQPESFE